MQFIDLKRQQERIRPDLERRISAVLEHGRYILGPEVFELEERLAEFTGAEHCISVSSGTDALLMTMMALGVGPGDEVITTPFSFIATAETIAFLGATPVYVDIRPDDYNIDVDAVEQAITEKTKAIMPVSLYGQCAELNRINEIAGRQNLPVIEDAAQSFGATHYGRRSCSMTTVGCTSFFPSKPLGAYGDGGAIFTSDANLAGTIREIRDHGQDRRYHHVRLGINGRLDSLQAAVLLAKMDIFPSEIEARQAAAARYSDCLGDAIDAPMVRPYNTSVYAQYTVRVQNREHLQEKLTEAGIPNAVHYPMPLHHQPALKQPGSFPNAERAAREVMSLPMHPYLTAQEQRTIADHLATLCTVREN